MPTKYIKNRNLEITFIKEQQLSSKTGEKENVKIFFYEFPNWTLIELLL